MSEQDSHLHRIKPGSPSSSIPQVPGTGALPFHTMSKMGAKNLLTDPQRDGAPSRENKLQNCPKGW